jgi:hypothetical protein
MKSHKDEIHFDEEGFNSPVSVSLISLWLSGTHNFTVETLVDIQQTLGISLLNVESPI